MLNGKFYTGLTANQMNRVRGPDRQKSSFFWPDETDTVPSPNNRSGRASRPSATNHTPSPKSSTAPSTPAGDSKAKELFNKQLTSNIGFYDNEPQHQHQHRRNAKPCQTEKLTDLKTLCQDISDIAEQIDKPRRGAITNAAKADTYHHQEDSRIRRTEKTSHPTIKKITFNEPSASAATKKGILKNNEQNASASVGEQQQQQYSVDQIPTYKKNITTTPTITRRIQLSKSVDNMARLAKAVEPSISKRNNVEHEKTVHREKYERSHHMMDSDDDDYEAKPSVRQYDEHYHQDDQTDNGRNVKYSVKEQVHHDEWTDRNDGQRRINHHQRTKQQSHHHQQQHHHSSVINNTGRYHNEDYQTKNHNIEVQLFEEHRSADSPPPIINHRSNDDVGYAKHYAHVAEAPNNTGRRTITSSNNNNSSSQNGPPQPSAGVRSVHHKNKVYPNEAAVRAQSHLRSNIFFGDNNDSHSSVETDRPRSVRQSAVARVGVGLPNI